MAGRSARRSNRADRPISETVRTCRRASRLPNRSSGSQSLAPRCGKPNESSTASRDSPTSRIGNMLFVLTKFMSRDLGIGRSRERRVLSAEGDPCQPVLDYCAPPVKRLWQEQKVAPVHYPEAAIFEQSEGFLGPQQVRVNIHRRPAHDAPGDRIQGVVLDDAENPARFRS